MAAGGREAVRVDDEVIGATRVPARGADPRARAALGSQDPRGRDPERGAGRGAGRLWRRHVPRQQPEPGGRTPGSAGPSSQLQSGAGECPPNRPRPTLPARQRQGSRILDCCHGHGGKPARSGHVHISAPNSVCTRRSSLSAAGLPWKLGGRPAQLRVRRPTMIGTVKHSAPVGRNTRQHSDSARRGPAHAPAYPSEQPDQSFHPDTASPACPGRDSSPSGGAAAEQAPD